MQAKAFILTIDLGTSGPKVCIFDENLVLIESAFHEVPLYLVGQNGAEQNPQDWIFAIKKCIQELRVKNEQLLKRVDAINVTAQWSGTVALDSNHHPIGNAITCMDSRGAPYAHQLTDGLLTVDGYDLIKVLRWIQITGGAPTKSGKDSIAHILYLKNECPEIYHETNVFLEPLDYLNYFLSGRVCASHDSISLHWITDNRDINHIKYSDSLIKKCGIDAKKLPPLIPTNSILGKIRPELAIEWGISPDTQIVSGTPDVQSAAVGSGGVKDYIPHLYIGTSSWLVCHVPFKKTDLLHNLASIPSGIPGRYMLINEQQTAGACLQFLKNQIFFPKNSIMGEVAPVDIYKKMDLLASEVPAGSDGLLFLPWLNGERTPVDQQHLRGGLINLSLQHEQKHMIRAVMEGVALNSRWLMQHAEKYCGKTFEAIHFIGGGAHSHIWSQIFADVLNRPIKRMKDPLTANSKGAAALGLVALGKLTMAEVEAKIEVNETLLPNPNTIEIYNQSFKNFRKFYCKNSSFFKEMNQRVKTK